MDNFDWLKNTLCVNNKICVWMVLFRENRMGGLCGLEVFTAHTATQFNKLSKFMICLIIENLISKK